MEEKSFLNSFNHEVHYLSWEIDKNKANVVISHGMAEHPERYNELALYLNENGYNCYAIYHIGHGKWAKIEGNMDLGEFDECVSNLNELIYLVNKETNKDVFLLGHSMGSFIAQLYIERYHNIKGCILSGSTASTPIMKIGKVVADINFAFKKDKTSKSPFMDKMSFGSYNNSIKNHKTAFDWLNRDEAEVQKYINDKECGFVCTTSFFKNLCTALSEMNKSENLKKIDKELPILIHGGSNDPVSNLGKGLEQLDKLYTKYGIKNHTLIIYQDARHEIYNELNKKEVYQNTINFLNKYI